MIALGIIESCQSSPFCGTKRFFNCWNGSNYQNTRSREPEPESAAPGGMPGGMGGMGGVAVWVALAVYLNGQLGPPLYTNKFSRSIFNRIDSFFRDLLTDRKSFQ